MIKEEYVVDELVEVITQSVQAAIDAAEEVGQKEVSVYVGKEGVLLSAEEALLAFENYNARIIEREMGKDHFTGEYFIRVKLVEEVEEDV